MTKTPIEELHHSVTLPSVTVSIVSHGQAALVRKLVANLNATSAQSIACAVITLNIHEQDMLEDLPAFFPIVRLVNQAPKGFGANHNQAFQHCRTPWFLVLNPDMHFNDDVLTTLVSHAAPSAALLAPRILEPGKREPEPHRAILTPLEILTRRRPTYLTPLVPDWIPGLFMLFRSNAFAQVHGFNEKFFMYGEDFDICARLQLAGWQLQIDEATLAVHDARRASHARPRHFHWHMSSLVRLWLSPVFWRFKTLKRLK